MAGNCACYVACGSEVVGRLACRSAQAGGSGCEYVRNEIEEQAVGAIDAMVFVLFRLSCIGVAFRCDDYEILCSMRKMVRYARFLRRPT